MGRVCELQEKYILYDADTAAGSSGSPVFYVRNEDCCVLALHKSGGVLTLSCKQPVNKGVYINIILDHLIGGKQSM
jgi:V8-like Glu-specific endopeptidase